MKLISMRSNFSKKYCSIYTCKVRMCSSKLEPIHLAIPLLKRNFSTRCRLHWLSSISWWLLFWKLWVLVCGWCINNSDRQRSNCLLLFRGGTSWQSTFPHWTTILIADSAIHQIIFYGNRIYIWSKLLCFKSILVSRWANLNIYTTDLIIILSA